MGEKKQYTEGIDINNNNFFKWLDNYWYHYKWVTIVVAFFLVVFIVCTVQTCTKKNGDVLLTYAGPASLDIDDKVVIENAAEKVLAKYSEKQSDITVSVASYYVLSRDQIQNIEKQTDSEGYALYVDKSFVSNEKDSFESQLKTGSGSVILLEKWIYDSFFDSEGATERLVPLSEVFGTTPEGAIDDYGVRLGDTRFYKDNPQLSFLSPDTVICLHSKIIGQKKYDQQVEAFKALVGPNAEND